jgi:predicted NAD-dependent protein-ADP-ribosyltransferase YbiA (DUF1768 family)
MDYQYESPVYEMELFDHNYEITIGKERSTYAKTKGIYFYPIYLVHKGRIQMQIGIFETKTHLDDTNEDDIGQFGEPLLYSFVNEDILAKYILSTTATSDDMEKIHAKITDDLIHKKHEISDEISKQTELIIPESKKSAEKKSIDAVIQKGIFTVDKSKRMFIELEEENDAIHRARKAEYSESAKNNWVQKFMKNNHYNIVDTAENGDCFFDAIRLAYQQMGYMTTIEKLRAIVANAATETVFNEYRTIYLNFEKERLSKQAEYKQNMKIMRELSKRNIDAKSRAEADDLANQGKEIKENMLQLKRDIKELEEIMQEFIFMQNVDTLDRFRAIIQTTAYWADTWAITTIERELKMKVVILSEEYFKQGDYNGVMQCGQINDSDVDEMEPIKNPEFYIMVAYTGRHYRLISYMNKYIFQFYEVPYGVKIMIVIKCMERNSGPYYLIPDFRNFKSKLGLDPNEGAPSEDEDENVNEPNSRNIEFHFYIRSADKRAGQGTGERIPKSRISEFADLNQIKEWRKKLDDEWMTKFELDGKSWSSIQHYYEAAKFRKTRPDFYAKFAIESGTPLSTNIEMAKAAGKKSGKMGDQVIRPKDVGFDADFYDGKRDKEEREKAVFAKFDQNADLKSILLKTRNAELYHIEPQKKHEKDLILMKVRKQLQ